MKNLIFINGTMGAGKSSVCAELLKMLPNAVYLDGDWCWNMHPFIVTDETKAMVVRNIAHLLQSFLNCSEFQNVIFCWVMHEQAIIDGLLARLPLRDVQVIAVSLVCTPDALAARIGRDVAAGLRTPDVLARSLSRLPLYDALNTARLDTTRLTPEETARAIRELSSAYQKE